MPFEARLERIQAALRHQREKEAKDKVEQQARLTDAKQKRSDEILADSRFQEMWSLANSPELHEALEQYIQNVHPETNTPAPIVFRQTSTTENEPLDSVNVQKVLYTTTVGGGYNWGEQGTASEVTRFLRVSIRWRQNEERRVQRELGRSISYTGDNAKPGLSLQMFDDAFNSYLNINRPPIFYDLESFLDYIAQEIIKRGK